WKLFRLDNSYTFLIIGFFLYGLGAVTMIGAFKFGKYSVIHPMMCTSYIFAILLGGLFLKEYISIYQIIGIAIISLGVVFIGGGDE
ncbi:MAG: EamA family transporter, partial [Fusobacteriaceae bacterium]